MNIIKDLFCTCKRHGIKLLLLFLMLLSIMSSMHVYVKDAFSILLLIMLGVRKFDKTAKLLLCFSLTYSFFIFVKSPTNVTEIFSYLICPTTFYLLGKRIIEESPSEQDMLNVFIILTLGINVVLWVNNVSDSIEYGIVNVARVIENDTQREISATLQGLLLSVGISGIGYTIASGSLFKWRSIVFLIFSLLSLFCTVHLVNRTGMVIFAIAVLVSMFFVFRQKKGYIVLAGLFLYAVYILLSYYGIINEEILDAYEARSFDQDTGGGRTEIWALSLSDLMNNPFGWEGREIGYSKGYCHNLWLDVARRAGWLPFFFLVYITIGKVKDLTKFAYKEKNILAGYMMSLIVCALVSSFMEPVIEGISLYFYFICFLWGIQNDYANKEFKDIFYCKC